MSEQLGLTEAVSIALGGMIDGGIYAVLGVVTGIAGPATWTAFVFAGAVALCAGYSYTALNELVDDDGGSVTFVQSFTGNSTLAGMTGWTLLFGYIGRWRCTPSPSRNSPWRSASSRTPSAASRSGP